MKEFQKHTSEMNWLNRFSELTNRLLPRQYKVIGSALVTEVNIVESTGVGVITLGHPNHPLNLRAVVPIEDLEEYSVDKRVAVISRKILDPIGKLVILAEETYIGPERLLQKGSPLDEKDLILASLKHEDTGNQTP